MFGRIKRLLFSNAFEYFYYIFMGFLLIITILGLSFYFYFASILKNKAIDENNAMLIQVKNAQEAVLAETSKVISSIVLDPTIRNYMDYYRSRDNIMMMMVQNSIENTVVLYDSIDSIFVDYVNEGIILSSEQGTLSCDNFYESAFVKRSEIQNVTGSKVIARSKKDFLDGKKIGVISFVSTIPINLTKGRPNAIVVSNLKSEYLQNSLNGIKLSDQANILVIDKNGSIICNINGQPMEETQDIITYIREKCPESSGDAIVQLNHQKMLLSYIESANFSWKYIYTVPISEVTQGIGVLGVAASLFCFLMVVLSVFGSVMISRKLYSPIKNALALFKTGKYVAGQKRAKETVLLQDSINTIIKKNDSLESLLSDYEAFQKNNFLLSLLTEAGGDKSMEEKLKYYGIELDPEGYFVAIVISLDNFAELTDKYSQKQINMLHIYIRESITQMLPDGNKGFIVAGKDNVMIVVLCITDNPVGYRNMAQSIHKTVCSNLKYTITFGVSTPQKGLHSLSACYAEGMTAVNYRMLGGYNSVNVYADIVSHSGNVVPYPFSMERKIVSCIKANNDEELQRALDEYINYLYCNPSDNIEFVRHYFLQLLSACVKCFYEMDQKFDSHVQPLSEVFASVIKQETLADMASLLKQLYKEVMDYLGTQRKNRNVELVTLISEYIEKNIQLDLSLENIADNFCISVSHLRKIFKEEKGIPPKDFIASIRLNKACTLLENSSLKIGEISEQVGYFSIQAFTRAFKKEIGKTPGEYRMESVKRNIRTLY